MELAIKEVLSIVLGLLVGVIGWAAKRIHGRLDHQDTRIIALEKNDAVKSSQINDMRVDIKEILAKQDKILEKFNG